MQVFKQGFGKTLSGTVYDCLAHSCYSILPVVLADPPNLVCFYTTHSGLVPLVRKHSWQSRFLALL